MFDVESGVLNGIIGFITTLAGVLIAFALTLGNDRKKKKADEDETRNRIAKAIQIELESNLKLVDGIREMHSKEEKEGFLILFPSGAYQSALSGGFLSLFNSNLQYSLGATYTQFRWTETVSARLLSLIGGIEMTYSNYSDNMKNFQAIIDNQLATLQKLVPELLKGNGEARKLTFSD